MLETVQFPVGECVQCGPNTLIATGLNQQDELEPICARCGSIDVTVRRSLGAKFMRGLGFTIEGEDDSPGCGNATGVCSGTCGSGCK